MDTSAVWQSASKSVSSCVHEEETPTRWRKFYSQWTISNTGFTDAIALDSHWLLLTKLVLFCCYCLRHALTFQKRACFFSSVLPVSASVPATASESKFLRFPSRRMTTRLIFTSPHTNSNFFPDSFFSSFPSKILPVHVLWDAEGGSFSGEPPYPYQWRPFFTWCQWEQQQITTSRSCRGKEKGKKEGKNREAKNRLS